ncbi:flagellar assembly protein FliH [Iodobacter ciconiae]|nr:flagellar assembly protein FliH [Iodobacter ciconiae]
MSSLSVIPRGQLSAWEKWELGSLNEAEAEAAALGEESLVPLDQTPDLSLAEDNTGPDAEEDLAPLPTESIDVPDADVAFPTAEEIEAIVQRAQSEGFEAGLEAGRLMAEDETNRLRLVLASVESTLKKAEATLSNEVLDLAVAIARQMVRDELQHAPERLLPLLREVLASLPAARSPSRVFLNPDDLLAVEGMLGGDFPADTWRLLPDSQLETGGCRIETPDSAVDLSLPVRWGNILRVLGRHGRADLGWGESEEHAGPPSSFAAENSESLFELSSAEGVPEPIAAPTVAPALSPEEAVPSGENIAASDSQLSAESGHHD